MASTEINTILFDESILLNLDLSRLDSSIQRDVLAMLKHMQSDLIKSLGSDDLTGWGRRRLQQQLRESREIIARYYADIEASTLASTSGIAQVASTSAAQALSVAVGGSGVGTLGANGLVSGILPTTTYMEALAGNAIIQGATQQEWWAEQSRDMQSRFSRAVKEGLLNAETNQQIINRIKDIEGITDKNAEKLVRTSVQTIAHHARQKTFEQNQDVIAGYAWITTLDGKACQFCIARDNKEWDINHKPIGHSIPFRVPPIHFNDRCSLVAKTKTFRQLGIDIDEVNDTDRASMTGVVNDTDFESYMNRRGKTFIDGVLGKGRSELYRNGTISFKQLTDGKGKPLTLKQLQDKYL